MNYVKMSFACFILLSNVVTRKCKISLMLHLGRTSLEASAGSRHAFPSCAPCPCCSAPQGPTASASLMSLSVCSPSPHTLLGFPFPPASLLCTETVPVGNTRPFCRHHGAELLLVPCFQMIILCI